MVPRGTKCLRILIFAFFAKGGEGVGGGGGAVKDFK